MGWGVYDEGMSSHGEFESRRLRVALFGGSFDPPHFGHVGVARAALEALHLDTVLFAPVGAQPLKPQGASAPFADRVEMTRLAIAGEPGFALSLLDAPQADGAPNYTLDTLHRLRAERPGAELFLLLGADSFALLRNWHGAAKIPFAASLIVASRPGGQIENLAPYLPASIRIAAAESAPGPAPHLDPDLGTYTLTNAAGETAALYLLPGLDIPISASEIRNQLQGHADADESGLVPAAVADYIWRHGLYQ